MYQKYPLPHARVAAIVNFLVHYYPQAITAKYITFCAPNTVTILEMKQTNNIIWIKVLFYGTCLFITDRTLFD